MELTGIAGHIIGWAFLITVYGIIILGLFCAWSYIWFEVIIRHVFTWLKAYDAFLQFVWDHRRYIGDKKRKKNK